MRTRNDAGDAVGGIPVPEFAAAGLFCEIWVRVRGVAEGFAGVVGDGTTAGGASFAVAGDDGNWGEREKHEESGEEEPMEMHFGRGGWLMDLVVSSL